MHKIQYLKVSRVQRLWPCTSLYHDGVHVTNSTLFDAALLPAAADVVVTFVTWAQPCVFGTPGCSNRNQVNLHGMRCGSRSHFSVTTLLHIVMLYSCSNIS